MSTTVATKQTKSLADFMGFVRITHDTYIRQPSCADPKDVPPTTPTILLLFWMNLPIRPMIKYVIQFVRLADLMGARIICMTCTSADLLFRCSEGMQARRVAPVIKALTQGTTHSRRRPAKFVTLPEPGPLYVHAFSNSGCFTLAHIARTYRATTGRPLPAKSIVLDSAPGIPSLMRGYRAYGLHLPKAQPRRLIASAILFSTLVMHEIVSVVFPAMSASNYARRMLNNPAVIAVPSKRTYMYSDADDTTPSSDILAHAAEAEKKGWIVSTKSFEGSSHVAHMRMHPERYWRIVNAAFDYIPKL